MFNPKRIIFEKNALSYPLAQSIKDYFEPRNDIEKIYLSNNKIKSSIPGETLPEFYSHGKKTLVIGVHKSSSFQSCKPSAHYQLPLISGCMGKCQYCYLNTRLGDKPYLKINVNTDDIFTQASKYIQERMPELTIFEGSATSDPVPVEPYTHSLEQAIVFFGANEFSRFRFVTKYTDVDSLQNLPHHGHTEVRFSINTDTVINQYELATASRDNRIAASIKMIKAGYPVGFLIAPVFLYTGWEEDYHQLLCCLHDSLPPTLHYPLTFEIITHRYTTAAKNKILQIFPNTTVPMDDEARKYKHGQFGYGKFVYDKESMQRVKTFFTEEIDRLFDFKEIKYII